MSINEDFDQTQTKRSGWNNYKYTKNKNYREKPFKFNGLAAEYQRLHDLFRVNLAQKSALCIPYLLEGGHANDQDERFKIAEIPPNLFTFGKGDGTIRLYCHVDSAYQNYSNGKSHYGYSFGLYTHGHCKDATFYARSVKMKLVVLSSTEAEYVALCEACTEITFLRQLLADIGFPQPKPTIIYEDNQSVIQMVKGKGNHQRTKHINARYHFSRQCVHKHLILLRYCPTHKMVADIFTKGSIPSKQFQSLCNKLLNTKSSNTITTE